MKSVVAAAVVELIIVMVSVEAATINFDLYGS